MKWSDGLKYRGSWKGGKQHGIGVKTNEEGKVVYEGEYKCGLRDGHGIDWTMLPILIGKWTVGQFIAESPVPRSKLLEGAGLSEEGHQHSCTLAAGVRMLSI